MDNLLQDVLKTLLDHALPQPGECVLDIGCGTGASSLALANLVGADGHVTAVDISAPLLALARARAAATRQIDCVLADAQTYPFPAGQSDLLVSRFGVMFFENPVAAFENLRKAMRPGGRLAMICWQGAPENPWFMLPMQAAVARLGKPAPLDPLAPGPMAFKDIDRVTAILTDAGWDSAKGTPVDVDLIPPQTPETAADFATTIGPATRVWREKGGTEEDLTVIRAACAAAFATYNTDAGLRIPARLIVYTARNGT